VITRLSNVLGRLVPNKVQSFIGRHFTWLSGTLFGFSIAINLLLILIYVPGATANAAISSVLSIGAVTFSLVTFTGGALTIKDYLDKRDSFDDPESEPEGTVDGGLSSPAQGFVRTTEEQMREAMDELEGWFVIQEDGSIEFQNEESELSADQRGALYVFAAQIGYESRVRDTPKVSKEEIREAVGFSGPAATVFMSKMYDTENDEFFVTFDFNPQDRAAMRDMAEDEMTFKLNRDNVSEVVKYIKGERSAPD